MHLVAANALPDIYVLTIDTLSTSVYTRTAHIQFAGTGLCDAAASFWRSLTASSTASIFTAPKSTPAPVWRLFKIGLEPAVALIGTSSASPAGAPKYMSCTDAPCNMLLSKRFSNVKLFGQQPVAALVAESVCVSVLQTECSSFANVTAIGRDCIQDAIASQ